MFLVPTYASIWFAGRWYATRQLYAWRTLVPLVLALAVGTLMAFLISNTSFYLLSGRFPELSWMEYGARVAKYLPPYATSAFLYVLFAAVLHALIAGVGIRTASARQQ